VRSNVLLVLTAALPAILTASTISIGLGTSPMDFTATSSTTGIIKVGACSRDCELNGRDAAIVPFTWSLKSAGPLTYTYSGTPDVYDLGGNTTSFFLTDKRGESVSGTITWNTATVEASTPPAGKRKSARVAPSGTLTDVNGTLKLGTVDFASNTDAFAKEVMEAFGSLPSDGKQGSLDFSANCSPVACIGAPIDVVKAGKRGFKDPAGSIELAAVTFDSTAVPEPGSMFALPGLFLACLILRKRLLS